MTDREKARREEQREESLAQQAFTINEFSARNNICRETVYQQIRRGQLRARKVGKRTLIFFEDERAWRASLPVLVLSASAA